MFIVCNQENISSFFSMLCIKDASIDENDQVGGPEGYHELSDNSQFSFGSEDGIVNNGKCNLVIRLPESRA